MLEGGGLDVNGQGTLLVTEEWLLSDVQVRNPGLTRADYEEIFAEWLGIRQTIWLGERYYNAAGGVLAVTGVLLVLDGDWSWGTEFIWVGLAVVVIGGAMGGLLFGPLAKRRAAALESGDTATADEAQGRIMPLALLDTALILVAVWAMVDKWGL